MSKINVSLSGTKSLQDIQEIRLRRTGGSTFELTIKHPTGAVERLLNDTSGKLDTLDIRQGQDGNVQVYISGKGVKREGPR